MLNRDVLGGEKLGEDGFVGGEILLHGKEYIPSQKRVKGNYALKINVLLAVFVSD
jgi:hypothetical protein